MKFKLYNIANQPWRRLDWVLIGAAVLLVCFGLVELYSSTLTNPLIWVMFRKQLIISIAGIILMFSLGLSDYRAYKTFSKIIFFIIVFLLAVVLVVGQAVRGSTAWLQVWGGVVQPVEFAKLALLLILGRYFANHIGEAGQWRPLLASGLIMASGVGLVLLQPDLGSAIVLVVIWLVMLFFFRLRSRQWWLLIGSGLLIILAAWFGLLSPYQKDRVATFLNPAGDPLGSGYNVQQSIVAVGSGQIWGRGIGLGSQSQLKFLPEQHSDFIFASIAEELGLLGAVAVLILLATVIVRLVIIAQRSEDDFGTLICLGLAGWLAIQAFINIGGCLGLVPLTGLTLPLVSAGGSSLLAVLMSLGLAQSVALRGRHGFN